ncbi:MAG: hypothetical protein J6S71_02830 [Clostridia bacterium]|nr:hypothetical protein [Clostridia bacterium]
MKKAIFIGNSFIYYGGCVYTGRTWKQDETKSINYTARQDDRAYFYQICKQYGIDISVTDATHGGRVLANFTPTGDGAEYSTVGIDLLGGYDLSTYTDVFISEAGRNNPDFIRDIEAVMSRFTKHETKFYYLIHNYTASQKHNEIYSALPYLREKGVKIIPWGDLVYDIWVGDAEIVDAECKYNKNSFIVKQSARDGFHENPLCGYITAQMCFTAMMGISAENTDLSFCGEVINFEKYISDHYGFEGSTTNFPEILASRDMKQIKKYCDEYLEKFN